MSLDDETLMAFADGELAEDRAAKVAQAVAADPALAARVERFRAVRTRMAGALDGLLPAPDLMARAQRTEADRAIARGSRFWGSAVAASLAGAIAVFGVLLASREDDGLNADFRPRGGLAAALDRTPSGATRTYAGGSASPLYTVVSADGRPCRAFRMMARSAPYEGVACRNADGWRVLVIAAAPGRPGGYAQASGDETPAVGATLDALKPGDPLSVSDEAALIERRWRRE